MQQHHLELLIRQKLQTGALPRDEIPRFWGGPGNLETCDACESVITNDELVMEGVSVGRKPFELHVECFHLWDRARRTLGVETLPSRGAEDGADVG